MAVELPRHLDPTNPLPTIHKKVRRSVEKKHLDVNKYCSWFRNPAITSWYGKYPHYLYTEFLYIPCRWFSRRISEASTVLHGKKNTSSLTVGIVQHPSFCFVATRSSGLVALCAPGSTRSFGDVSQGMPKINLSHWFNTPDPVDWVIGDEILPSDIIMGIIIRHETLWIK